MIKKLKGIEMDIVLANPGYEIKTENAYNELDKKEHGKKESSLKLKDARNAKEAASGMHNDFIHIQKDDVKKIINNLIDNGALNTSITGKGPTVFGIFENEKKAKNAYEKLRNNYPFVYKGKTII